MLWQICIRYPDGKEQAVCSYTDREIALKYIDDIYVHGDSTHLSYVLRPTSNLLSG